MKNYAAMAQGMPQQENPMELVQPTEQDRMQAQEIALSEEEMQSVNLPTGNQPEQVKERIVILLERFSLLEGLSASDKMKLMQQVDLLVEDIMIGNVQGIGENPINHMLSGVGEQLSEISVPTMGEEDAV